MPPFTDKSVHLPCHCILNVIFPVLSHGCTPYLYEFRISVPLPELHAGKSHHPGNLQLKFISLSRVSSFHFYYKQFMFWPLHFLCYLTNMHFSVFNFKTINLGNMPLCACQLCTYTSLHNRKSHKSCINSQVKTLLSHYMWNFSVKFVVPCRGVEVVTNNCMM
jgi:hypothetical protein